MSGDGETFAFQAEINQLLSLIINTFYSNKEVFLRELISNASDALDKAKYELLGNKEKYDGVVGSGGEGSIKIVPDKEGGRLLIIDNGIGMTREDMIKNLGTIAHSGTRAFMENLKNGNGTVDVSLIGQFGVGFYSAYLVADKVRVVSRSLMGRSDGDGVGGYVWESNAGGTFIVREASEEEVGVVGSYGTCIELYLKEDQKGDYLEEHKLKTIIQKHSQYIGYPIYLEVVREKDVAAEEGDVADDTADGVVEDVADETKPKKVKIMEKELDRVNKQAPIWLRKPEEVKDEEYASFYKSFANDWEDHLAVKHFSVEGNVEFKGLLFIPPRAPFDMFGGSGHEKKMNNIKLYVKKVMITDKSDDMFPEYLSFIRGIVDSNDLPLNVSREMLQQNSVMKIIKKNLVKKSLEMMAELATGDNDKWQKFYGAFNKNIKLGYIEDTKNRLKIVELLRFHSSKNGGEVGAGVSLKDYVTRMKEGQKSIYYVTGESVSVVDKMACLEKLKKKGYEVLYMVDPIDEYLCQHLIEYDSKNFVNCAKEDFLLDESSEDAGRKEEIAKEWSGVCAKIKEILGDKVKDVIVSERLVNRPCVLVADKYGWSANMERIMKAQALRNAESFMFMQAKKIMEINVEHGLMKTLKDRISEGEEGAGGIDKNIERIVGVLYETVCIDSGFSLEDPAKYAGAIYRMMELGLNGEEESACDGGAKEESEEGEGENISLMEEVD